MNNIVEDSYYIPSFLNDALNFYEILKDEIEWHDSENKGGLIPRKCSIQTDQILASNDIQPIYRYPIDNEPRAILFTPTVNYICDYLNKYFGVKCNHCLVQWYRNGSDFIGEHSDKTLDIKKGSNVYNVSFGDTRVLKLKKKKSNIINNHVYINVPLEDNSCFVLGHKTNNLYRHGINTDKSRLKKGILKVSGRISLTFREISTFISTKPIKNTDLGICICIKCDRCIDTYSEYDNIYICGQGCPKINNNSISFEKNMQKLHALFSLENSLNNFNWDLEYGTMLAKGYFGFLPSK